MVEQDLCSPTRSTSKANSFLAQRRAKRRSQVASSETSKPQSAVDDGFVGATGATGAVSPEEGAEREKNKTPSMKKTERIHCSHKYSEIDQVELADPSKDHRGEKSSPQNIYRISVQSMSPFTLEEGPLSPSPPVPAIPPDPISSSGLSSSSRFASRSPIPRRRRGRRSASPHVSTSKDGGLPQTASPLRSSPRSSPCSSPIPRRRPRSPRISPRFSPISSNSTHSPVMMTDRELRLHGIGRSPGSLAARKRAESPRTIKDHSRQERSVANDFLAKRRAARRKQERQTTSTDKEFLRPEPQMLHQQQICKSEPKNTAFSTTKEHSRATNQRPHYEQQKKVGQLIHDQRRQQQIREKPTQSPQELHEVDRRNIRRETSGQEGIKSLEKEGSEQKQIQLNELTRQLNNVRQQTSTSNGGVSLADVIGPPPPPPPQSPLTGLPPPPPPPMIQRTVRMTSQPKKLVVLISNGVSDRRQATNQTRALTLLAAKKVAFETVDGMDPLQIER